MMTRDSETAILLREVQTIRKWDIFTDGCNNLQEVKCQEAALEHLDGPSQPCKSTPVFTGRGQAGVHATVSENSE